MFLVYGPHSRLAMFFFKNFPPSSPIMSHNWKHDLSRSCFILLLLASKSKSYVDLSRRWPTCIHHPLHWVIELSVDLLYNCTVGHFWTENPFFMSFVQLLTQFSFLVSKRQSPEMNCKLVLQRSNSTNIKILGVPNVVLNSTHTQNFSSTC